MIAPTQIRKPENWQDFERLCTKLWGEIWKCQDTIKRNGRLGQDQNGVDIYGMPDGEDEYYGIQCKGKSDYSKSELTEKEIDEEIENAKKFQPALKQLIFATSANKDAKIETYVRMKNIQHRKSGLFGVDVFAWEDIVSRIEEYRSVWNWYVNNCMYNDASDVKVSFTDNDEITICPYYVRMHTSYYHKYMPSSPFVTIKPVEIPSLFNKKKEYDSRWCDVYVKVENIGSTTLEDYKLKISFDGEIEALEVDIKLIEDIWLDMNLRNTVNNQRKAKQEVFYSEEFANEMVCVPLNKVLVEHDTKLFHIRVRPKNLQGESLVHWKFLSRSYTKEGDLRINIEAEIKDEYKEEPVTEGLPLPAPKEDLIYIFEQEKD